MNKKYQKGGKLKSEELGSNLKGGTFYTTKSGKVGRITTNGLGKDNEVNRSIDTTGYSCGRPSFEYTRKSSSGTQGVSVGRESVLPIIENLKKGATKMRKPKEAGNQSCVTAGGCSKPKPPRLKPEVERSVAASINRSARSESERRNMYERAGIQYQSVSASTRPARTFDIPAKKTEPKKAEPKKVIEKKPQEEAISKPDTTYKYYKRSSGEKAFQEKNLKATSSTQLTSPNVFNKGGKMPLKKASGKGKAALAARKK